MQFGKYEESQVRVENGNVALETKEKVRKRGFQERKGC